ncbi:MAG: general secretion pathway protein GspK [Gammaproteobacteria bacterium]|nr:MAG: general secretion pathway protein GspK [Gammaproteobacteria bacterium]
MKQKQGGMALILVLLITALVTIVAVSMESRTALTIKRTGHYAFREQAQHLAYAAESYAREILYADWDQDKRDNAFVDAPDETWAQGAIRIPLTTYAGLEGQIDDMQGRFNINSLVSRNAQGESVVNTVALNQFRRLLSLLDISPELNAEKFVDWMDADEEIYQFKGAEDETYLLKEPPYRAANGPFNDLSELWLIDGMTEEDFDKLSRVLSVLPTATFSLNVNMAPREVLMSLHPGIDAGKADALIKVRKDTPFKDVQSFLAEDALAGLGLGESGLTVRSNYFRLRVKVHFDDRIVRLQSLIYRDSKGKMTTVRRDFGKRFTIDKSTVEVN